jgi:hypothetical protein
MAYSKRVPEDEWEPSESDPSPPHRSRRQAGSRDSQTKTDSCEDGTEDEALLGAVDMEPGQAAASALMRFQGEVLLKVMLRPSFHPIHDTTMVPIYRCPYCGDGGLRTAGTIRMRKGYAFVRACDTCLAVEVGERHVG